MNTYVRGGDEVILREGKVGFPQILRIFAPDLI